MPRIAKRLLVTCAWLALWQLLAALVHNDILLVGPVEVLLTLAGSVPAPGFWLSITFSLVRIVGGFLAAFALGLFVGALAARFRALEEFLEPAVAVLKSVPIVCFIVLLLMWFGSLYVSAIAVFLVGFPAIYAAVLEGLKARNLHTAQLLEVYRVQTLRKACIYYWPTLLPFMLSTGRVAVGMAWKSGVAAELIGLPLGGIGEHIYHAKLTLSSAELFAWTLMIVLLALACEKLFLLALRSSKRWLWCLALPRGAAGGAAKSKARGAAKGEADNVASGATCNAKTGALASAGEEAGEPRHRNGCGAANARALTPLAEEAGEAPLRVSLKNVSVSFEGARVFDNLNLTLEPGGRYALRGPSGSGKTTLLAVLEGLQAPQSGSLEFEPHQRIAAVFQEARLFEDYSAVENIRMLAGAQAQEAAVRAQLAALLPPSALDKPVRELSGGMRRRVELVRALATPANLLLLDEPFAGLDEASHLAAAQLLLCKLGGRTLVVATHDTSDEEALGLVPLTLAP